MTEETISWTFYGYTTPAGGQDVQEWFDGLLDEEQDEVRDVLGYLQKLRRELWKEPKFEPLDQGISEIKFKVNMLDRIYRIYGAFWPEGKRYSYTFLIGKNKKVDNDRRGKKEAVERLKKLRRKEATVHEFEFERRRASEAQAREGGPKTIH
jgi:hypothetical protein